MANNCDTVTNTNVATAHFLKVQSEILLTKLLKEGVWVTWPLALISDPRPPDPKKFQPAQSPPNQSPFTMIMYTLLSMVRDLFKPR